MEIILAGSQNLSEIVALDQIARFQSWGLEQWSSEMNHKESQIFILSENTRILGVLSGRMNGLEAELFMILVHPTRRREGLAKSMLNHWISQLRGQGVEGVYLDVSHQNQSAIALYEQFGFELLNLRKKYYSDGADALMMKLTC